MDDAKAGVCMAIGAVGGALLIRVIQMSPLVEWDGIVWWAMEASRWTLAIVVVWMLARILLRLNRRLSRAENQLREIGVIVEISRLGLDIDAEEGVLSTQ